MSPDLPKKKKQTRALILTVMYRCRLLSPVHSSSHCPWPMNTSACRTSTCRPYHGAASVWTSHLYQNYREVAGESLSETLCGLYLIWKISPGCFCFFKSLSAITSEHRKTQNRAERKASSVVPFSADRTKS